LLHDATRARTEDAPGSFIGIAGPTQWLPGVSSLGAGYDLGMGSLLTGVTVGLLAATLTSCSSMQVDEVRSTAARFYAAYADGDGDAACDELAPKTRSELEKSAEKPCSKALLEEELPNVSEPTDIHVFSTQAELRWGAETTFLGRFEGGWKVIAAACTPQPGRPYDCSISGG
jgi:hypothetical protein